ncbi:YfcC family protein [Terrisporobacter mayombei]|uniref:YfcC family protein n=1 Tax=Terrisporobacter mayombei TaxID=1541 RepID=UPI00265A5FD5|nr:Na+/H+ antiporter NhaC family protein [Terrisporobacter mayombei]MCC3669169.1 YfcC family protein [Terrisporobacter mayombei]
MSTNEKKKRSFKLPTAYTVLLAITAIIAIATYFIPGVKKASLADFVMAPITGLQEAIDIAIFVLLIGGFLGVTTKTGALDAGIGNVVAKLKGKELILIPVLMFIFSLGGTSFGMAEETIAFTALVTTTMIIAGFDPLVSVASIILGAGCGVLGSTVNPFLVSVSIGALKGVDIAANQVIVIGTGVALWLISLLISIFFVMNYAKKVHADKSKTLLSDSEIRQANEAFIGNKSGEEEVIEFTGKRKVVLSLFAFTFIVMVLGIIPWEQFGINLFKGTGFLTGNSLGNWWFSDLGMWFVIMAVVIGLVYRTKEVEIVNAFLDGAAEMVGVALVIGVSKGISVIMSTTGLDAYVLSSASSVLVGMSPIIFTIVAFLIYMALSFFIPSTSGLAGLSMPIFGPLAVSLGFPPEVIISIFSAGSGLINLVTPTSGVIMGTLAIAKVDYSSWVKFVTKVLLAIFVACAIILCIAMMFV